MQIRTLGALGLILAACGHPAAPPIVAPLPQLPAPAREPLPESTVSGAAFVDEADAGLTPLDQATHASAREAARAGDLYEAKRLLAQLVFAYPDHATLLAQYNAIAGRVQAARDVSKAALEAMPLRTPAAPPAKYTLVSPAPAAGTIPKVVLRSQVKNQITDDEAWFTSHDLRTTEYVIEPQRGMLWAPGMLSTQLAIDLKSSFVFFAYEPSHRFAAARLPIEIPGSYGSLALTQAIDSKPYLIAIYGERVVAVFDAARHPVALFDFVQFATPPASVAGEAKVGQVTLTTAAGTQRRDLTVATQSIQLQLAYALAADGMLYVEHWYNGYTKAAKGQTGYITALDLKTGTLAWRSDPQRGNVENFVIVGGGLVTGYGFTAEPRFVHVLDRSTGKTTQTLRTVTTPNVFVPKDGALYVRGYDHDFVFDLR